MLQLRGPSVASDTDSRPREPERTPPVWRVAPSAAIAGRVVTVQTGSAEGTPAPAVTLSALTIDGADVLGSAAGTGPWSIAAPSSASSATVAWTVRATNPAGTVAASGAVTAPADLSAPAAMAAPALAGGVAAATLTLPADPANGGLPILARDYQIAAAVDPGFAAPVAQGQSSTAGAAIPASPLAPGGYVARVRARNAAGAGPWSPISAVAVVAAAQPAAPTLPPALPAAVQIVPSALSVVEGGAIHFRPTNLADWGVSDREVQQQGFWRWRFSVGQPAEDYAFEALAPGRVRVPVKRAGEGFGPFAAHAYRTPGAHTARVTVRYKGREAVRDATVTVVALETAYPAARRIHVDPDGAFAGVPAEIAAANRVTTLGAAAARAAAIGQPCAVLLRRGATHLLSGTVTVGTTLKHLAAYGTGAKPRLRKNPAHVQSTVTVTPYGWWTGTGSMTMLRIDGPDAIIRDVVFEGDYRPDDPKVMRPDLATGALADDYATIVGLIDGALADPARSAADANGARFITDAPTMASINALAARFHNFWPWEVNSEAIQPRDGADRFTILDCEMRGLRSLSTFSVVGQLAGGAVIGCVAEDWYNYAVQFGNVNPATGYVALVGNRFEQNVNARYGDEEKTENHQRFAHFAPLPGGNNADHGPVRIEFGVGIVINRNRLFTNNGWSVSSSAITPASTQPALRMLQSSAANQSFCVTENDMAGSIACTPANGQGFLRLQGPQVVAFNAFTVTERERYVLGTAYDGAMWNNIVFTSEGFTEPRYPIFLSLMGGTPIDPWLHEEIPAVRRFPIYSNTVIYNWDTVGTNLRIAGNGALGVVDAIGPVPKRPMGNYPATTPDNARGQSGNGAQTVFTFTNVETHGNYATLLALVNRTAVPETTVPAPGAVPAGQVRIARTGTVGTNETVTLTFGTPPPASPYAGGLPNVHLTNTPTYPDGRFYANPQPPLNTPAADCDNNLIVVRNAVANFATINLVANVGEAPVALDRAALLPSAFTGLDTLGRVSAGSNVLGAAGAGDVAEVDFLGNPRPAQPAIGAVEAGTDLSFWQGLPRSPDGVSAEWTGSRFLAAGETIGPAGSGADRTPMIAIADAGANPALTAADVRALIRVNGAFRRLPLALAEGDRVELAPSWGHPARPTVEPAWRQKVVQPAGWLPAQVTNGAATWVHVDNFVNGQAGLLATRLRVTGRPGALQVLYGNGTTGGAFNLSVNSGGNLELRTNNLLTTRVIGNVPAGGSWEGSIIVAYDTRTRGNRLGGVACKIWVNGTVVAGGGTPDNRLVNVTGLGVGAVGFNGSAARAAGGLTVIGWFAYYATDTLDPATDAGLLFGNAAAGYAPVYLPGDSAVAGPPAVLLEGVAAWNNPRIDRVRVTGAWV